MSTARKGVLGALVAIALIALGGLYRTLASRGAAHATSAHAAASPGPDPGTLTPRDDGVRESVARSDATAPSTVTVRARIVDGAYAPLERAQLRIQFGGARARQRTAIADDDGHVLLEWTAEESERGPLASLVIASADGCEPLSFETELSDGVTDLGTLVLQRKARLSGLVVDEQGLPVPGAAVVATDGGRQIFGASQAARLGPYPKFVPPWAEQETDDHGRFRFEGIESGTMRLWARAEGYSWAMSEPIEAQIGESHEGLVVTLTSHLARDELIRGIVLSPEGTPAPDVWVTLAYGATTGRIEISTRSDARGRFELVSLGPNVHHLRSEDPADRWLPSSIVHARPGDAVELRFVRPERRLAVEVVTPSGDPVQEASASTFGTGPARRPLSENDEARSDARVVVDEPSEPFVLEVGAPHFVTRVLGPYEPGSLADVVQVELEPAPGIHGVVLFRGDPVARASVRLFERAGEDEYYWVRGMPSYVSPLRQRTTTTDDAGAFFFEVEPDRAHVVRAEHPDHAPGEVLVPAMRRARSLVEVPLTVGGAIEGIVDTSVGGTPAPGTIVVANRGDGCPATAVAGPDGAFQLEGLTPGRWHVATMESTPEGEGRAEIAASENVFPSNCVVSPGKTTRCDLHLDTTLATVRGSFSLDGSTTSGSTTSGWTARLRPSVRARSSRGAKDTLDDTGSFALSIDATGPARLTFTPPDPGLGLTWTIRIDVTPGPNRVDLRFEAADLTIEGVRDGATLYDSAFLTWEEGNASMLHRLKPDPRGACHVRGVPVGRVEVFRFRDAPETWSLRKPHDVLAVVALGTSGTETVDLGMR